MRLEGTELTGEGTGLRGEVKCVDMSYSLFLGLELRFSFLSLPTGERREIVFIQVK